MRKVVPARRHQQAGDIQAIDIAQHRENQAQVLGYADVAGCGVGEVNQEAHLGRKQFFFEKKNQKTFQYLAEPIRERPKPNV
jgi:hypothetical protein